MARTNRSGNLHSKVVAWLKILLPLAALAALSTLFLVARTVDPESAIPYAQVDVEDRIREPRLTMPAWAAVTNDGSALAIRAEQARVNNDGAPPLAQAVEAEMLTPDGGRTDLRADQGRMNEAAGLLELEGDVVVTTSSGYRITTQALTARLDQTELRSDLPILVETPMGPLEAGSMQLSAAEDADKRYLLVFNGGVKLLYQP